jgi:hypothetical protein
MTVEFHHGALCDDYEKQANAQGFTFGDDKEWVQNVGYGLVCAHIHGCITDGEYDKILRRFQQKILIKRLKPLAESEDKYGKI